MKANTLENFHALINKTASCWLWTGFVNNKGYGFIHIRKLFKTRLAHRIMYELHFGSIPDGMAVCHTCDNPPCVNPEHLFLGTMKDNMQDCSIKGRIKHIKFSLHQVEAIHKLFNNGVGLPAIGQKFGVDASVIKRVCGERPHPQKKSFTKAQIADIIARAHAGETHVGIGRIYNISNTQVMRILKRNNSFIKPKRGRPKSIMPPSAVLAGPRNCSPRGSFP